jgi:hypothetical protein
MSYPTLQDYIDNGYKEYPVSGLESKWAYAMAQKWIRDSHNSKMFAITVYFPKNMGDYQPANGGTAKVQFHLSNTTALNLENWTVENIADMEQMFINTYYSLSAQSED